MRPCALLLCLAACNGKGVLVSTESQQKTSSTPAASGDATASPGNDQGTNGNGAGSGGSASGGSSDGVDQPAEVAGMFLACDQLQGTTPPSGQVDLGCAAVDGDGQRLALRGLTWSLVAGGRTAPLTIAPPVSPDWDATLTLPAALLGTAVIAAVAGGEAATFATVAPPKAPAAIDATLGAVCQSGFAALPIATTPGACPSGAVVVAAKDGWDLRFSCCMLPEPAALSADPAAQNVARDGACAEGEVQTGFADALRPLCTRIDTSRFKTLGAATATYVSASAGVGEEGAAAASDVQAYLAKAARSEVCLCPDLRMVFAGGHTGSAGKCEDRCVLLQADGEAEPLGTLATVDATVSDSGELPHLHASSGENDNENND